MFALWCQTPRRIGQSPELLLCIPIHLHSKALPRCIMYHYYMFGYQLGALLDSLATTNRMQLVSVPVSLLYFVLEINILLPPPPPSGHTAICLHLYGNNVRYKHSMSNKACVFGRNTTNPIITQIAKFIGPTWGPPGSCRPQMGPMLTPGTLLSGTLYIQLKI